MALLLIAPLVVMFVLCCLFAVWLRSDPGIGTTN